MEQSKDLRRLLAKQPLSVRLKRSFVEFDPKKTLSLRRKVQTLFLCNKGRLFTIKEIRAAIKAGTEGSLGVTVRDLRRRSMMNGNPLNVEMERVRVRGTLTATYGLKGKAA